MIDHSAKSLVAVPAITQSATRPRIPPWRLDAAALVLLASAISLLGRSAYPVWTDDAWYAAAVSGGYDLREWLRDRPLLASFWQFWSDHGGYLGVAAAVDLLAWGGLALSTMWVWRLLFPGYKRYGLVAGCAVLAPLLCTIQLVLVNFPIAAVAGPAMATIALGLALSANGSAIGDRLRLAASVGLILLGGQLSEYSAPTAVVGAVILFLRSGWQERSSESLRRGLLWAGVFLLAAVASYAVYHSLGEPLVRERVRPELVLTSSLSWRLKVFIPRLVSQYWLTTGGAIASFLGRVRFDSLQTLCGAAVGIVLAMLVTIKVLRPMRIVGSDNSAVESHPSSPQPDIGSIVMLGIALLCGLVPMVFMGAVSEGGASSRYLVPILPVATWTTLSILLRLVNRRFWWILPAFAGFAVGYGQTTDFLLAREDEKNLVKWSAEVRKHIAAEGLTIAVFDRPWSHSDFVSGSFELTYWLTASPDWTDGQREHFWAFGNLVQTSASKGTVELFSSRPSMDLMIRGVGRTGPISRILWLRREGNALLIESTQTLDFHP